MGPTQRIVQRVKWLVAVVLDAAGVLAWLRGRRAARGDVAVLWLHRVDGTPDARVPMGVPPNVFRRLVSELCGRYDVSSWEACVAGVGRPAPRARVAITFDDGYADNATHAWPILREAGVTAVFCLTTAFLDGAPLWWEAVAAAVNREGPRYPVDGVGEATYGEAAERRIAALKTRPNFERVATVAEIVSGGFAHALPPALSWDAARRMATEGAVLGGHTATHPVLTTCEPGELAAELADSRTRIQKEIGAPVTLFAYPNGSHDESVVAATREAGYTHAFTIEKGTFSAGTDPLRIPRIGVSEPKYSLNGADFSWPLFEAEMLGVFDWLLARRWRR